MSRAPLLGLKNQRADLVVDLDRDLLRVVALIHVEVAAEEGVSLVVTAVGDRAELLAHAEFRDHATRQYRRLFDIVAGPGRRLLEHQLLRYAPPINTAIRANA